MSLVVPEAVCADRAARTMESPMQRLLNVASKTLAVFGVLVLMWTASKVQAQSPAVADAPNATILYCSRPVAVTSAPATSAPS